MQGLFNGFRFFYSKDLFKSALPTSIFVFIWCSTYRALLSSYIQSSIINKLCSILPSTYFSATKCCISVAIFGTLRNGGVDVAFPVWLLGYSSPQPFRHQANSPIRTIFPEPIRRVMVGHVRRTQSLKRTLRWTTLV